MVIKNFLKNFIVKLYYIKCTINKTFCFKMFKDLIKYPYNLF